MDITIVSGIQSQFIGFTYLGTKDLIALIHPALAVAFVFPLIGITSNYAWQTRQRRLQIKNGGKSKIPAIAGKNTCKSGVG